MAGFTWELFLNRYCVELNLHICIPVTIAAVTSIVLALQVKYEARNNALKFDRVHERLDEHGKLIDINKADIKYVVREQASVKQEVAEIKLEQKYGRKIIDGS